MPVLKIKTRLVSFIIVLAVYIFSFFISILVFNLFNNIHILLSSLLADIAATLAVWFFGIIFDNSSLYDPYWSVAPLVIIPFWILSAGTSFSLFEILLFTAIFLWGIRLTFNWAKRWKGLSHQDWRYIKLKKDNPRLWFLTNLIGINLMPTLIVYMALIPAYFGIVSKGSLSILAIVGFIISIASVFIQAISDFQMDLFKKNRLFPNEFINSGLWRYCRHPNYFAEVLFWWGIWILQVGINPKIWMTIIGPVVVTILFIFISIPMMEKYILSSKPSYSVYRSQVAMFIPWFRIK
jgi:steroid 5-alpha reductase family enzyme